MRTAPQDLLGCYCFVVFQTNTSLGDSSDSSYIPSPTEFRAMLPRLQFQQNILRRVCINNNWFSFVKMPLRVLERGNISSSGLYYIDRVMGTGDTGEQPPHPVEYVRFTRPATLLFDLHRSLQKRATISERL